MNTSEGLLELSMMNAEAKSSAFDDFFVWGTERGIPPEVLTRLKGVWNITKELAGEIVSVGRIIVDKILAFLKDNPQLTVGMALGAAVGVLIAMIPVLGPILAPVGTVITAAYGAGVGAALEAGETTADATDPMVAAINLARKFFELLVDIFKAVTSYWSPEDGLTA